ncbi:MAG: glycosyltransferase [Candidatus Gygaella obscura]|nr:glycosyltransferase [Candidatus Gygaella obscura]
MKNRFPKVSIITVNFNGKKFLKNLLDGLFFLNYPKDKTEIIFIDNGSSDGSVAFVKNKYPKVKIIRNKLNNYCVGINLGIKASKAEFVALLNNDTKVDKDWLVELVSCIRTGKNIAAVGSKVLKYDGLIQTAGHYELPNYYWGERHSGKKSASLSKREQVDSLCGASVIYNRALIFKLGLFDEDFIMYGEDVDISYRLRSAGYRLLVEPKSIVYHTFHGTASVELSNFYIERNRLLFIAKHMPDRLPGALLGNGYFVTTKNQHNKSGIYEVLSIVLRKLIDNSSLEKVNYLMPQIFAELRKIIAYENDYLSNEINKLRDNLDKTYKTYKKIDKELFDKKDELARKDEQKQKLDRQIKEIRINDLANLKRINNQQNLLLKQQQKEIVSVKKDVSKLSDSVNDREKQIIKRDSEYSKLKESIESLRDSIRSKDSQSNQHLFSIKRLGEEQQTLNSQLEKKKSEIVAKDYEISKLKENLAHSRDILDLKEADLKEKSNYIDQFSDSLRNVNTQLEIRIEELSKQFAFIQEEYDKKLKELHDSNINTEKLKAEIAGLDSGLKDKRNQLIDKDKELKASIEQIVCLRNEIDCIYSSKGYRFILSPIWKTIFLFKKFFSSLRQLLLKVKQILTSLVLKPVALIKKIARIILLVFNRTFLAKLFWFGVSAVCSFFVLLLFLGLSAEYLLWNLLRPVLSRIKPKRNPIKVNDSVKISLVMPNYNGIDILKEALPTIFSIERFANGNDEVLIVDDASKDGSVKFIKENYPKIKLIRNYRNKGFGYTSNRAVKSAKHEVVVLINNDIKLTKDFLKHLVDSLKDKNVFSVTPKLYGWDEKTFAWGMHMGHFENGYIRLWNECETGNGDRINRPSPSLFAIGGAMVFRKSDFIWLKGFDSIYKPNCWEDIDISYRAWKRGLKVIYEPRSLLFHKARATLTYERPKEIKNELLFTWKNITDKNILLNHINLLPDNFYRYRMSFLKGFLWALLFLPRALLHRLMERPFIKQDDSLIINHCMNYYRNFRLRGFKHLLPQEKKTILMVTSFLPFPLNIGGRIRIYNLAKQLSKKYNVMLLSLIDKEEELNCVPELKKVFKEVFTVFPKSPLNLKLFPERYKFSYSQILIEKLIELNNEYAIDFIQIESNELLYLQPYIDYTPVVYTEHDCSSLFYKNSYYKRNGFLADFFDYLKRVRFHILALSKLKHIIVLSKEDRSILRSFLPEKKFSLIPTGVDLEHFKFSETIKSRGNRLIYVGHYPHYPNEDAVVHFVKKIFPLIRKHVPDIEFHIVGSGVTDAVSNLAHSKGVKVIGEVEDVYDYLRFADIFVNPIRISSGIKGKVLEAMAVGLPVVSTKIGSSGITALGGKEIILVNSNINFARQVVRLVKNSELRLKIAKDARLFVEHNYDWQRVYTMLDSFFEDIYTLSLPEERANMDLANLVNTLNENLQDSIDQGDISYDFQNGPKELHIELDYHCNSRCIMCDLWDYSKRNNSKEVLTKNDIKKLLDTSNKLEHIDTVVLSGGEPFLKNDLFDICRILLQKYPHLSLGILTNGIDTQRIIDISVRVKNELRPANFWLGTSLDGVGQVHDYVRGRKGAYDAVIATIAQCRKNNIEITATFTITAENFDCLLPAKKVADSCGIDFYIQFVVPKQERSTSVFKFSNKALSRIEKDLFELIRQELEKTGFKDQASASEIEKNPGLLAKIYYLSHLKKYQTDPKRYFRKCVAGSRFAMIDPLGRLYFCPGLKNAAIGNIKKEKFDDLWMSDKANNTRKFIYKQLCNCWLVCIVFPVIDKFLFEKEEDVKIANSKNSSILKVEDKRISFCNEHKSLQEYNRRVNKDEFDKGEIILKSTPRGIGLGVHWKCNANCVFCLGGHPKLFNMDTYRKFFEEKLFDILPRADYLNLCGFGELLLMPQCNELLTYLNNSLPHINKIITTNGSTITDEVIGYLTSGRYSLQVSMHASNQKLHNMITNLNNFDFIVGQIKKMLRQRKDKSSPSVNLVFVLNTFNVENLPDFIEFAARLGVDSVVCNYMTIYSQSHLKSSCFFKQDITNSMIEKAKATALKHNLIVNLPAMFNENSYPRVKCSDPWEYIYIETEGSVLPCCFAGSHISYLYRDDFKEIWNGQVYQELRRSLNNGGQALWCKHCIKNNASNVNNLRSHVSFREDIQKNILEFNK